MAKYLIDINLPYYFSLWNNDDFIHQKEINCTWHDNEIWDYAKKNNLTIITKDSDFSELILFSNPPLRVIHIRIGNVKMKQFHAIIGNLWLSICEMSETHKLVNVFTDRIEGIQ